MAPIDHCRICGVLGPMTFEHVPPRAAFNSEMSIALDMKHYLETVPHEPISAARRQKQPRGSGGYHLCARCNNETGALYVPAYVGWVMQGQRFRSTLGRTNSISLPFNILPGRIFKQILAIFACTCGPGLFNKNPQLRKLVLDRNARGLPDHLRMYAYIVDAESQTSRTSGIAGIISPSGGHTVAEFAYPPFGYLLTFGDSPPPERGLMDITFFANHGYDAYRELHLRMPIRPVESFFPADYRNRAEWDEANARVAEQAA